MWCGYLLNYIFGEIKINKKAGPVVVPATRVRKERSVGPDVIAQLENPVAGPSGQSIQIERFADNRQTAEQCPHHERIKGQDNPGAFDGGFGPRKDNVLYSRFNFGTDKFLHGLLLFAQTMNEMTLFKLLLSYNAK